VSASTIAFFRCINKVTPLWNEELEAITQLQFSEISLCFDLIYKKYNTAFNLNAHKVLSVITTSENQRDIPSDLKLAKANSNFSEKSGLLQLKTEVANKSSIINKASVINDLKTTFIYQPKANGAAIISNNQMRDDLRFRTRYANGTVNTELPLRNITKNNI